MPSVLSLLCSLLICFSVSNRILTAPAQTNKSEIDRQALLCFKSGVTSDPLGTLSSWQNNSLSFCSWRGVTCGTRLPGRVVFLNLTSTRLGGLISGCIGNLASIYQIDLTDNNLSGAIPEELGKLPGLHTLVLAGNNLVGNIPDSLWSSLSLSFVNLANNTLSGGIPESLANSYSLKTLILSRNYLSGDIPATLFANLSALTMVDLQKNSFTGSIPPFGKVSGLMFLCLTENSLSGSIPPSIGNISSLTSILLGQNKLSGLIPESLSNIPKLLKLDLSYNILSGHIPLSIYNMSSLEYFSIGSNGLVGQIPSYIGYSLPNLLYFRMQNNKLVGQIPTSVTNTSNLQVFDLADNMLSGPVPSVGSLANLQHVILGSNRLEEDNWLFLASLANCTQLTKLSLERNILNGSLPISVVNLSRRLEYLWLGSNNISGFIPVDISNLVNLTLLSMENNLLWGNIPCTIGKLRNLFVLNLSKNKLSGEIPPSISDITQLGELYLDDNNLTGDIPSSLGHCLGLLKINLSSNKLNGLLPKELFTGPPFSLGLDFSHNNLSGEIPSEVLRMNSAFLNFSNNHFSGSPLVLCVNPPFGQLDDLSNNNFDVPIPIGACFRNSNVLPPGANRKCASVCNDSATETKKHVPMLLIGILISLSTIGFVLLLYLVFSLWKRKVELTISWWNRMLSMLMFVAHRTREMHTCFSQEEMLNEANSTQPSQNCWKTMKKVSYGDILKATKCFSPVNRVSSSRTASVYIGRFQFDTDLVAIKVFHLNEHGSHNSFFTECEVLKHVRHRNLVQAITLCLTVDFDNNEFKALVYEFMANGSLDMWIYPRLHQGSPRRVLSLGQRITIIADVASALDYLHNQFIPPLIHCDLKPSNVLLDYDMTSHVGDFGSAKFLSPNPEGLVGFGGTIGYIAPEYGMGGEISTSGDVYSFGVLLLELLTAKRPTDALFCNGFSLQKYMELALPDKVDKVLDTHLAYQDGKVTASLCMENYIIPLVEIGLICSAKSPENRPGIRDVCAKIGAIKEAFAKTL